MISRLSHRNNIPGLTAPRPRATDLPLCTNVIDYSQDGGTDPSLPIPAQVSLTFNSPIKAIFIALGTVGFTSSLNSYGVSPSSAYLPFTVSNPKRHQMKVDLSTNLLRVTRYSDSPATVFDTRPATVPDRFENGLYLRSDFQYLHLFYATVSSGQVFNNALFVVAAPLKVLPRNLTVQGITYDKRNGVVTTSYIDERTTVLATTASQIIQLNELEFLEFPIASSVGGITSVVYGVSTLAFTL